MQAEVQEEVIDPNHHLVMQGRRHFREVINSAGRIAKRIGDPSQDTALGIANQLGLQTMVVDGYTPSAVINAWIQAGVLIMSTYAPDADKRTDLLANTVNVLIARVQEG